MIYNCTSRFKLTSLIFLLVFFNCLSQSFSSFTYNNKRYIKESGKWFVVSEDNSKFLVDTLSLTVKLNNMGNDYLLDLLSKQEKIVIKTKNILGYIDILLPKTGNFFQNFSRIKDNPIFESVEINSYGELLSIPNDANYSIQFNLFNSSIYPHIHAEDAWEIENGSSNPVIIASLDQGISPDISDFNYATGGYDFFESDNDPTPSSGNNHGAFTASAFCSKTNNGNFLASVSGGWGTNLGTKVLVIRVGNDSSFSNSIIDDAIIYAAEHNAKIINMSFKTEENNSIKAAIDYVSRYYGCLIVAASGNMNKSGIEFPAKYAPVIAVGGIMININQQWIGYGNYGAELDVLAPSINVPAIKDNTSWEYVSGTSIAAPQVAGIGALLLSSRPSFTPKDFENVLKYSSHPISDPNYSCYGLVDAYNSLLALGDNGVLPAPVNSISLSGLMGRNPIISWSYNIPESIQILKFNIYRSYNVTGRYYFTKVGEVNYSSQQINYSWTDPTVQRQSGAATYYYRVFAQTSNNVESVSSDEVSTTAISPEKLPSGKNIQINFEVEQNYPNPFNPSTTIKYSLTSDSWVKMTLINALGKTIKDYGNNFQNSGTHLIKIDLSNQASGIYFFKVSVNGMQKIIKLLLTK